MCLSHYFSRCFAKAMMSSSFGKTLVFSFEYTSSSLNCTSKQPPPDGINVSDLMSCLNVVNSLVVKLTA